MREGRLNGHEAHTELSHQQLVLVLTLIHWGGKDGRKKRGKNKGLWQREEKTDREILIVILVICKLSVTAKSASECACFLHQAFLCLHVCVRLHIIAATSFKKRRSKIRIKRKGGQMSEKRPFLKGLRKKGINSIFEEPCVRK